MDAPRPAYAPWRASNEAARGQAWYSAERALEAAGARLGTRLALAAADLRADRDRPYSGARMGLLDEVPPRERG